MDTKRTSLSDITSTSAQITLSLALMCYQAQYGELEFDKISQEQEYDEFIKRLTSIITNLTNEASGQALLATIDPSHETQLSRPPKKNSSYLPCKGKYFDDNDKIILSDSGVKQLAELLCAFPTSSENEVHRINQYEGNKTSPISTRRSVGVAAIWSLFASDLEYEVNNTDAGYLMENDSFSYGIDIFNSACYLGFKIAFSYFLVANAQKWARQVRSSDVVSWYRKAGIKALIQHNKSTTEPLAPHPFDEFNLQCNILQLKGYISAQASKMRKRLTLSLAIVASVAFISMDISSCGITLAMRLGLAIGIGALAGAIRYHSKRTQNRRKLFAKSYREEITQTFQKPLLAELTIYGLQPIDIKDTIASNRIGVKRQVQSDVEQLLSGLNFKLENINDLKYLSATQNERSLFVISTKDRAHFFQSIKNYAEEITPEKYHGCNKYFVMEVIFQIRKIIGDDQHEIDAEREDAFCRPTVNFFARQETKGVKRFHQMIQIHKAKTRSKDPKAAQNPSPATAQLKLAPVDEKMVTAQKEDKISLDTCDDINLATAEEVHRSINQGFGITHSGKESAKKHLETSFGFEYYKWQHFSVNPFQAIPTSFNNNMLEAYYEKIYARHERKLTAQKTPSTSAFHKSGKTLFHDLIGSRKSSEEYAKKQTQYDKKKDEYKKSMAGVFESSAWSALRVTLCACIPLFNFLPQANEAVTQLVTQATATTALSAAGTYIAISHSRKIKREARLAEAGNQQPSLLANVSTFFGGKSDYSPVPSMDNNCLSPSISQ